MIAMHRVLRSACGAAAAVALTACAGGGGLGSVGEILGSVLGGQAGGNQVAGTVQGVDTRAQQISLQQSNGQAVAILFDSKTRVIYQNRAYTVASLERGDQVVARIASAANNTPYTDSIHVTQSVSGSGGTASGGTVGGEQVQSLQGVVRQVDRTGGRFTLDISSGTTLTVSLPYNVRSTDATRFQNLRAGDQVRFYGVFLNNTRVELREFY